MYHEKKKSRSMRRLFFLVHLDGMFLAIEPILASFVAQGRQSQRPAVLPGKIADPTSKGQRGQKGQEGQASNLALF